MNYIYCAFMVLILSETAAAAEIKLSDIDKYPPITWQVGDNIDVFGRIITIEKGTSNIVIKFKNGTDLSTLEIPQAKKMEAK